MTAAPPPLPLRREDWTGAIREDLEERASIIWADRGAIDTPTARRDADRDAAILIRQRYAKHGR